MKKMFFLLTCLVFVSICHAQKKAVTETGEEVILFEDGTWKHANESDQANVEIQTNPNKFKKSDNSTFLLKSTRLNVGFWINPKKWKFQKAVENPDAEYELELKGEDLYSMVISEKVEIPLTTLKEIALENGRAISPDVHIFKEEYRTVNGLKVLLLQMNGTMQGIKFSYYGYYYSNPNGTVQFITYTAQNLLETYIKDIEELLNGFVEL